jgi:hypothetical protein
VEPLVSAALLELMNTEIISGKLELARQEEGYLGITRTSLRKGLPVSKGLELLLVHLCLGWAAYGFYNLLKRDYAEKLYEERKLLEIDRRVLKKETWLRVHRWIAVLGLVFVGALYLLTMMKIVEKL